MDLGKKENLKTPLLILGILYLNAYGSYVFWSHYSAQEIFLFYYRQDYDKKNTLVLSVFLSSHF